MASFSPDYSSVVSGLPALPAYLQPRAEDYVYAPQGAQPSWLFGGLKAGVASGAGGVGSALEAGGKLVGSPTVERLGGQLADWGAQKTAEWGRPDLEPAPWSAQGGGLGSALPWAGYQLAKSVPSLAAMIAAGAAIPEAAVPAGLAAFGAKVVPAALGGGGTGALWARNILAGTAIMYPQAVGGMYQQAKESPDGASRGEAAASLGLGAPLAALSSVGPASVGILAHGLEGNILTRVGTAGAANAVAGAVQGGLGAAADMSFRPDIPVSQKMQTIVDSTLSSAAIGGMMGGLFGLRRERPADVTNDQIGEMVDKSIGSQKMLEAPAMMGSPKLEEPLALPAPSDANRPPMRNRVTTPFEQMEPPTAGSELAAPVLEDSGQYTLPGFKPKPEVIPQDAPIVQQADQTGMFSEIARTEQVQAVREQMRDAAGLKNDPTHPANDFINSIEATTPEIARIEIQDKIDSMLGDKGWIEKPSKPLAQLAEAFGILKGGKFRDLDSEQIAAQDNLKLLQARIAANPGASTNPKALRELDAAQAAVKDVAIQKAFRDASEQMRNAEPETQVVEQAPEVKTIEQAPEVKVVAPHDLARELLGKQPEEALPAGLTRAKLQTEDDLRAFVETGMNKKNPAKYILKLDEALNAKDSEPAVKGEQDAVQIAKSEGVDVQQLPENGGGVAGTHTQRNGPPEAGEPEIRPQEGPAAAPAQVRAFAAQILGDNLSQPIRPEPQVPKLVRDAARTPPVDPWGGFEPLPADVAQGYRKQLQAVLADQFLPHSFRDRVERAARMVDNGSPLAEQTATKIIDEYGLPKFQKVLSEQDKTQVALSAPAFAQALQKVAKLLSPKSLKTFDIVEHAGELPEPILREAAKQNVAPDSIRGVNFQGKNYVVRDNIRSPADLQEVIFHEMTHGAAREVYGAGHSDAMLNIFDWAGGTDRLLNIAKKFGVEKQLRDYIPDGVMTSRDKSAFADEMLAQVGGVATGKFKTTLMAWASDIKQATISFLNKNGMTALAQRWDKLGAADVAAILRDMRKATLGEYFKGDTDASFARTPQGTDETLRKFGEAASLVEKALDKVENVAERMMVGWRAANNIADQYEKWLPSTRDLVKAQSFRDVLLSRIGIMHDDARQGLSEIAKLGPAADKLIGRMTSVYSSLGIDPHKTWDQHTWLHDSPNAKELSVKVNEANSDLRSLARLQGVKGVDAYEKAIASNNADRYSEASMKLYNLVKSEGIGGEIGGFEAHPGEAYRDAPATLDPVTGKQLTPHESPALSSTFWQSTLDRQLAGVDAYINAQRGLASTDKRQARNIYERISPIEQAATDIRAQLDSMKQYPYFHLGRSGDYYVAMKLKQNEAGTAPDPRAVAALTKALTDKGLDGLSVDAASEVASVFTRVQTIEQQNIIRDIAFSLKKAGYLDPNQDVRVGSRGDMAMMKDVAPKWIQKIIANMDAEPTTGMTPEELSARATIHRELTGLYMDSLPDNALFKVQMQRQGVQGFSKDAEQNFLARSQVNANAIAALSTASQINEAMARMRADVRDWGTKPTSEISTQKLATLNAIASEFGLREAQKPWKVQNSFLDTARAMNHTWFLSASPAYVLEVVTQTGILGWPELAKTHGFLESGKALALATAKSFKVMTAAVRGEHAVDAALTPEVLNKTGLPKSDIDFLVGLASRGKLDFGSFTRVMGAPRTDAGAWASKALKWSNATAVYAETQSRVQTALAAKAMYDPKVNGPSLSNYVDSVIDQSMMQWNAANNPRMTGKMGVAGPLSPVMLAFSGYQFKLIDKLYREVATAIGRHEATPEEIAASKRFLAAHLGAVTTLAGTLGMPAASLFAGAASGLANFLTGSEEYDLATQYHSFLGHAFGKEVGEVLARGLPRALGVDMAKLGEQDIIPFTRFLTDRRKWEDKVKDQAFKSFGSPVSMASNIVLGGRDMLMGNYMKGAKEMVPAAIKGPIEAYRISQQGYVDKNGYKLPIASPNALDILTQAVGFVPAAKAEAQEAASAQSARKDAIQFQVANISRNIVLSLERGDNDSVKSWIAKAVEHDKQYPLSPIMSRIAGQVAHKTKSLAVAKGRGLPLGVNPADTRAREFTSGFNLR